VRPRTVAAVAVTGLLAAAVALAALPSDGPEPRPATTPARAVTRADVLAGISAGDVAPHLRALARAAGSGRTRAAGTPGDVATREHVVGALRAAGWRVQVQPVRFPSFDERRPPRVSVPGGTALAAGREARTLAYSGSGRASGRLRSVAHLGCHDADFSALRDGEVALVRRGSCRMSVKARKAQTAGAAAILVANDGGPGRTSAIAGTLGEPGLRIPAVFVSTAAARRLVAAGRVAISVDAVSERRATANVVADAGDGPRVVMAGAHLDSVADGPGINDDGSGVAALLAVAEAIGRRAPDGVHLRLAFWGAEELGLHGSRRYVAGLGRAARDALAAYVNLDMVGTRGGRTAVYAGDAAIRDALRLALRERGRADIREEDLGASSDHAPFAAAGIAVGGVFTGLDRCYHRACDDAGNVDAERTADAAAATAATLLGLGSP
jgi:peptidase M28-like protein/PA domain-containing protein